MSIHAPKKLFLSLRRRQIRERKEEQVKTHVGQIDETSRSGGTNTCVRSGILGVHAA